MYFLERLQKEAAEAGGALHVMNGMSAKPYCMFFKSAYV